jgi:hypothetical protein
MADQLEDESVEDCITFDAAKAHADKLAAELGRNKPTKELRGRFIRVTDESGAEVYRAPLTNSPPAIIH